MNRQSQGSHEEQKQQKVLFINRSYWPDAEATGQLLTELAEDLSDSFEVTVLTGQPNANPNNESFQASGREIRNGVHIERVRHTRFGKASKVGRLLNLVTFFISAAVRGIFLKRVDVIVVETDPFLMSLALPFLRIRHRCKTIIYLQDIYPDVAVQLGVVRNGFMIRLLRHCLFAIYRRADSVVVLSEDMKSLCVRHGIQSSRIHVLPNWADTNRIAPAKDHNPFRIDQNLQDKFVIMHSGNMGMGQELKPVLELAERLRDDARFAFLFVGEGARKKELQQLMEQKGLNNVRFLPYQPREKLGESLGAADLHVVAMKAAVRQCLMPSKLYGVLASGTPVLAIAPTNSELSQIVRDSHIGIVSDGTDLDQLVDRIRQLMEDTALAESFGFNARQLCVEKYDRKVITTRFGRVLQDVFEPAHEIEAQIMPGGNREATQPVTNSEPEVSHVR